MYVLGSVGLLRYLALLHVYVKLCVNVMWLLMPSRARPLAAAAAVANICIQVSLRLDTTICLTEQQKTNIHLILLSSNVGWATGRTETKTKLTRRKTEQAEKEEKVCDYYCIAHGIVPCCFHILFAKGEKTIIVS